MAENPHKSSQVQKLISEGLKNLGKPQGKREIATWLMPNVFQTLINEKTTFKTPLVKLTEGDISHFFGSRKNPKQVLSEKQVKNFYYYLNNPDEIWLDKKDESINFICYLQKDEIVDNRDVIKINIKIDKSNKQEPINYIGSAGRVSSRDIMKDKERYKKIKG